MKRPEADNAAAWSLPRVVNFFATHRSGTADVYASERFFIEPRLKAGVRVLDVGCAQGGFASVLAEHLGDFTYTGVDISADMIAAARVRHPRHAFHQVAEGRLGPAEGEQFDLVLVLGILHLHKKWRDTLTAAWRATAGSLIFDLRETEGPTIDDKSRSYMRMDFHGGDERHVEARVPYIVLNAGEALGAARTICAGTQRLSRYGYFHPVTASATTPVAEVMASVYCAER